MSPLQIVIISIFLTFSKVNGNDSNCFNADDETYPLFSYVTLYEKVKGMLEPATDCKPIQIWLIIRHGARNGIFDEMCSMKKANDLKLRVLENYKDPSMPEEDRLCTTNFETLKNWTWDFRSEYLHGFLSKKGWNEMNSLAKRFRKAYPDIFTGQYAPKNYLFKHTQVNRTEQSGIAFINGILDDVDVDDSYFEISEFDDVLLKSLALCKNWVVGLRNDSIYKETREFSDSKQFRKVIKNVSKRVGSRTPLPDTDIQSFYDNCRFDMIKVDKSPWCEVFSKWDLMLFELKQDINRYYTSSYGYDMNTKVGCIALKHLLTTFNKTVSNNGVLNGPKVTAMFTHEDRLDSLYVALGYAKDKKPLMASDFENILWNRKYRSSRLVPSGANVAAVLHDCGENVDDRFKLQLYINEHQMELPGCEKGVCDWKNFEKQYESVKSCDMNICDN